jgi:hemolysin activation/secretion protein
MRYGAVSRLPFLLLSLSVGFVSTAASAQVTPQPLPPTREQVSPTAPEPPRRGLPRLTVEGGIERSPCALGDPRYNDVRFTLQGVQFDGLPAGLPNSLADSYSNLVGTEQPISSVCEIRDRAATILRDAGYVAAVAVPEQRISDGVIHLRVLLAHLTQVRVRGNATGAERVLAAYLKKLTDMPVFNRFDAERYLLLASDLPGFTVRLTLRPGGTEPGEVVGDVVVERMPGYADINVQNWGSKELGRWGVLARGEIYGLTGLGDRTSLGLFSTTDPQEEKTVQLGQEVRLGPQGLRLGGLFTYSWAKPTIDGSEFDAETLLATLQADYPFIRSVRKTVNGTVGVDFVDQDVKLDAIALTRDRIRVAFGRVTLDATSTDFTSGRSPVEPKWRVTSSIEFRQGLDVFDASNRCGPAGEGCIGPGLIPPSRFEGDPTATVVRGLLYGEYRPIPKLTFEVGVRGQYSWDPLLRFEQFSVGNYTVGRGYDPGSLLGDRGWGSQSEIRFGSTVQKAPKKPAIEAYLFWDHAEVKSLHRLFVVDQPSVINSVGGGIRGTLDRFSIDAGIAIPLDRVGIPAHKPDPRFLISLATRLWPWSIR